MAGGSTHGSMGARDVSRTGETNIIKLNNWMPLPNPFGQPRVLPCPNRLKLKSVVLWNNAIALYMQYAHSRVIPALHARITSELLGLLHRRKLLLTQFGTRTFKMKPATFEKWVLT